MHRTAILPLILALGLVYAACANPRSTPARLGEQYETFQGLRAAPAELRDGNERLDIFVGIPSEVPDREPFDDVLYCIAQNAEEDPLPEVAERINASPPDKALYLYGKSVRGKYQIWHGGLDCCVVAIAVWHVSAAQYVYYDVGYKTSIFTWRNARTALTKAIKAANELR